MLAEAEVVGYVISHELKSPVRAVAAYAEELRKLPSVTEDAAALEFLELLSGENEKLKNQLQDLLEYVRLDTYKPAYSTVDMNEVLALAEESLADKVTESGAKVIREKLPEVMGHKGRLLRMFTALLDNALKFRGEKTPVIKISAAVQGAVCEFCIEDNGIGIEEDNLPFVFGLFQRLHGADEYEGTGAGLALARKIARTHGGDIRVESAFGEGSRFFVKLPHVSK